jgi:two-component system NarL family sensor kinase
MIYVLLVLLATSLLVHLHQLIQCLNYETESRKLQDRLQTVKASDYQREFVHELIDQYEHELQKLGAELHDELIQKLTVYRLYIDKLELADSVMAVHLITSQMKKDFQHIVGSVRKISRHLLPDDQINSFGDLMLELCRGIEVPGVAFVEFSSEGEEVELLPSHRQHLLRVTEELVNNILKHTIAWHVQVNLKFAAEELYITIEDDGQGFQELQHTLNNTRSIFFPLRMRLNMLDASINFRQGAKGTIVTLTYPYQIRPLL